MSKTNSEGETLVMQKLTESDKKSSPKPVARQSVRVKSKITVCNQDEKTKKNVSIMGGGKGQTSTSILVSVVNYLPLNNGQEC